MINDLPSGISAGARPLPRPAARLVSRAGVGCLLPRSWSRAPSQAEARRGNSQSMHGGHGVLLERHVPPEVTNHQVLSFQLAIQSEFSLGLAPK